MPCHAPRGKFIRLDEPVLRALRLRFELGYEAVGDVNARLETVADWKEPYREGVIYCVRAGRVRGVLLWNVWGQVDAARPLIAARGPFRPVDLQGRLPA